MESILKRITDEFGYNIPTLDWMDSTTKERAKNKLDKLQHKIGYPEITQQINRLEKYYKEVKNVN